MSEINKLINCGECKVQSMGRVSILGICTKHGIEIGSIVEVYIRKPISSNDINKD